MAEKLPTTKLSWNEVDPATLQPEAAKAYTAYKAIYAQAKKQREAFEALCLKASELPQTHRLVFSYNFGRLSIAIDLADTKAKAGSKAVAFSAIKV